MKGYWRSPPTRWHDPIVFGVMALAVFWLIGSLGNWLSGYGWGLR